MCKDPAHTMNTQEREARDGLMKLRTALGGCDDGILSDDSSVEDLDQQQEEAPGAPPATPAAPAPAAPPETTPAASYPLFKTAQAALVRRKNLPLKEKRASLVRIRDKLNEDLIKAVFPIKYWKPLRA